VSSSLLLLLVRVDEGDGELRMLGEGWRTCVVAVVGKVVRRDVQRADVDRG
jgi:hypothetical protein